MARGAGNLPITSRLGHATGTSTVRPTFLRTCSRGLFFRVIFCNLQQVDLPRRLFRDYYDRAPAADDLSRMQYLDTKTYLPADVLTKVDCKSMATSLEVRCPLLDHEFVEWSASLAPHWKLRMGHSKYALKRLAERLGVPSRSIHRPKQGFGMAPVRLVS